MGLCLSDEIILFATWCRLSKQKISLYHLLRVENRKLNICFNPLAIVNLNEPTCLNLHVHFKSFVEKSNINIFLRLNRPRNIIIKFWCITCFDEFTSTKIWFVLRRILVFHEFKTLWHDVRFRLMKHPVLDYWKIYFILIDLINTLLFTVFVQQIIILIKGAHKSFVIYTPTKLYRRFTDLDPSRYDKYVNTFLIISL